MKRLLVIMLAAIMACSMSAFAAETEDSMEAAETNAPEAAEAAEDAAVPEAAEEAPAVEAAEEAPAAEAAEEAPAAEAAEEAPAEKTIGGYYIANYAQATGQVNLAIISEPDLVWASEQAGTTIYYFAEDGSVKLYENSGVTEGTYEVTDDTLSITAGDVSYEYSYEFIDGLLVIRDEEGSSLLYDFVIEDMNYITMEDYSVIEIDKTQVEVTDETVENYMNTVLQGQTVYEQITEGETADGDIITISYEGILEGETEPFEGGSAEGLTVQLGSGALVDTYEEQLTGQQIGSTVAVAITYPDDYSQMEGLAGKKAVFTTTIESKTIANTPVLEDEWVQQYSSDNLPEQLNTVDEYRAFCRNYLETYTLHTAMINALAAKTTISGYNLNLAQLLVSSISNSLTQNAAYYGMTEEAFVQANGYETTDAYVQQEATYDLNLAMIVNRVMSDLGMSYTTEELDANLNDYLRLSGFSKNYTVDEYKEQVGTIGMWVYTNLEFKLDKAMEALEDRVVLTEPAEETEAAAAEEPAEADAAEATEAAEAEAESAE